MELDARSDVSDILRRGFITGLLLIAPLAVTFLVLRLIYSWIASNVSPILGVAFTKIGPAVELVAVAAVFAFITLLGVIVRNGFGHYVVKELDHFVKAVPVVRKIYTSVRQASNAIANNEDQFERVALVEWPRPGVHTIGFVTDQTPEDLSTELELAGEPEEQRYNVFVPMSPNPAGGFLAVVPESKLVMTDMTVSEGINFILTTGVSGDHEFSLEQFATTEEPDPTDLSDPADPDPSDPAA